MIRRVTKLLLPGAEKKGYFYREPVLAKPHIQQGLKKSQHLRMVGVGRDLWRSSSPTPLLKEVHLHSIQRTTIMF